jgi:SAM-dependent methyltransferase
VESLSEIARRRLYPPIADPNYLVLRSRRLIFQAWASQLQGEGLIALDVGGRYQPYRPLFGGQIDRYVAVDLTKSELVTVLANGEALPFAAQSFDVVICTQTLEYFRQPQAAMQQIFDLLKPGGVFLGSVAACAPRFADEERWRFLPGGLRTLLEPFACVEIVPELDSLGSMVRTVNLALHSFVRYAAVRRVYRWSLSPLLNLLGLGLGGLRLTSNDQFAANFSVRAVKKP